MLEQKAPIPPRPPVVRPPSALARRWPGPSTPAAGRVVLRTAALTGLVAAASVPLDRPGVGWVVTGFAGTAALIAMAVAQAGQEATAGHGRSGRIRPLWTAATLVLLGAGTVRAAGWLFVLCLLTAAVTGSLAIAGGKGLRALAAGAVAVPVAAARALPWGVRGATAVRSSGRARIGAAVAVSAVLLLVFGGLFASADAAFAELLTRVTPEVGAPTVVRWTFLFIAAAAGTLGAAYLLAAPPDLDGLERPAVARLRRLEWMLPLTALNAIFAAFVLVQLTVLFGGSGHVLRTAGLTYAEYARRGFWQLLAVTALTLLVLAAAARWAPKELRRDRILVRLLLGGLATLCLVIVASALYRMRTYEEVYGFTRLRVLVSVCELWLGLVLGMVLLAGVRLRATWLPRAVVGSAVAALIGLTALDPDRFIAERNVTRYEDTGKIDVPYLSGLSADAVPALDRLPYPLRGCALGEIGADLAAEPDDWREWNLGRARAREVLADAPATASTCDPPRYYR